MVMLKDEILIAAHVCSDGWVSKYNEKNSLQIVHGRRYYRPRIRYVIGYCNYDTTLMKLFVNTVFEAYGLKPRFTKSNTEVHFRSKKVFDRLTELGVGNSRTWLVSKEVFKSKLLIFVWLKAFFDDEGTIRDRLIIGDTINKAGAKQLSILLNKIKIRHSLRKYQYKYQGIRFRYRIVIYDIGEYNKLIGFNHSKKKAKLQKIIDKNE